MMCPSDAILFSESNDFHTEASSCRVTWIALVEAIFCSRSDIAVVAFQCRTSLRHPSLAPSELPASCGHFFAIRRPSRRDESQPTGTLAATCQEATQTCSRPTNPPSSR